MTRTTDTFQQVSLEVAERYEQSFVPALFAGLARHTVGSAGVGPGQHVLDVACGTGIVARTAAAVVGESGTVTGLDLNEAMLTVARRLRPDLAWYQGDAAALPFPDRSFDVALCQSGLMFVPDTTAALDEMARVVEPGGIVAVQLWSALDRQTGVRPLAEAVARYAGRDALDLIGTYFRLGDKEGLGELCNNAGLQVTDVRTLPIILHSPSIDDYITTEVESTPLIARITDATYRRIRDDARTGLAPFCTDSGELALPLEVFFVTARRRTRSST